MTLRIMALLFVALFTAGTTLSGGSITGGSLVGTSPEAFVTLEDSAEWGTGGTVVDLTGVIPPFRTHEEAQGSQPALPLNTAGWTTITLSACTEAALETALAAVTVDETIIDASACSDITASGLSGDLFINWSPAKDKLVLRGENDTDGTILRVVHDGLIPAVDGLSHRMLQIGSSVDPTPIATWGLDRGASLNSQVIGTVDALTEVYEGDIIWIGEPSGFAMYGSDASGPTELRLIRRVLCARWSDTNHGADCTGVSANGDIRLDKPMTMDFDPAGPYDFSDQFTAFEIKHIERLGGGTLTNNVANYIGLENFSIIHSHPYAVRPDRPAIRWQGVNYFWMKNVTLNGWSQNRLDFGLSTTHTGPGLIVSSRINDEAWDTTCSAAVLLLATTNPVQLTMDSPAECTWGAASEPIWFPDDFPIAAIRGTHAYTIVVPEAAGQITIALTGIDGAGMDTSPGGWGVALKFFSDASVYMRTGASGVEFADLTMDNTRIGILMQGAVETIIGYVDLWTDSQIGYNRGIFDHSGWGHALIEGVRSNAQWLTMMANSPAAGPGEGPSTIVYGGHFVDDGTSTTAAYGGSGYGGSSPGYWFDETGNTSRAGRQNYGLVAFGNVFGGVNTMIDTCDQPGSAAGCADNQASGIYLRSYVHETGNLWKTDIDARLAPYGVGSSANLTTVSPESEAGEANEGTELSVGDRGRGYPTSLYRTVVPSWWCTQSGTFPNIGAAYQDAEDAPHPNLPAQIRRLGTTCTPP